MPSSVRFPFRSEDAEHQRNLALSRFMMLLILGFAGYTVFLSVAVRERANVSHSEFFSIPLLSAAAIALVWFVRTSGFPPSFFGITVVDWKRHASEAVLLTLPLLGIVLAIKWALVRGTDQPLFDIAHTETCPLQLSLLVAYALLVPAQELACRGCVQSGLSAFLVGEKKQLHAIFASNVMFFVFHLHISYTLACIAFCAGIYWGNMYQRQRSLVGTSISHLLLGLWSFLVVGVPGVQ